MNDQFESYKSRIVPKDEYIFWHQALNRRAEVKAYNWSRTPIAAEEFANYAVWSFDEVWVESNWQDGRDPALFGKKDDQIYLLARWGTGEFPLRTERQIMLSYRREVERQAVRDNLGSQAFWAALNILLAVVGMIGIVFWKDDLVDVYTMLLSVAFLSEILRRRHKKRGLDRPVNIWERRALDFVKRQNAAV